MEQQISNPSSKHDKNRLVWCILISCLLHLTILIVLNYSPEIPKPKDQLFVTIKYTEPISHFDPIHNKPDSDTTIKKITKENDLSSLDQEIQSEVKRMMNCKKNSESTSKILVSDLCKTEKEILGIGVKLSFGTDIVLVVPDYLPAYIAGIREGTT